MLSAVGIVIGYYLPVNSRLINITLIISLCFGILVIWGWKVKFKHQWICWGLFILLISIYYFQLGALNWQQEELKKYLGQRIKVKGKIIKATSTSAGAKYILTNLELPELEVTTDKKVLITHWQPKQKFKRGTEILCTTKLQRPLRQRNPGGFSYRKYLRSQGIYAVGEVSNWSVRRIGSTNSLVINLFKLREKISRQINFHFNAPYNYLLQALLLGKKKKLPDEITNSFRKLGSSHLLVISGFHLGLISYFIFGLTAKFSSCLRLIIVELCLAIYLILTGLQLPALRAGLLITLTAVGKYLNRPIDIYNLLAGVGIILLLSNPYFLFTISFQLSLGAVAGITYFTSIVNSYLDWLPKKIAEIIAATVAAQISLFPLLSYHFHQISLTGVIANLMLMPLISISLVVGIIFVGISFLTASGAQLVSWGLGKLLKLDLLLVEWLANYLGLVIRTGTLSFLEITAYYLLVYAGSRLLQPVLIPYSKQYKRYFAIISLSLSLLLAGNLNLLVQDLQVTFLGVNGDAAYLQTPAGKKILVDSGKQGTAVVDFLTSKGIYKLDLVFISHFHQDHAGGLKQILANFKVDKICYPPLLEKNKLYKTLLAKMETQNTKLVKLDKKDKIALPSTRIKVLAPGKLISNSPANNNSLVFQLRYKKFNLLFTGDIEALAEQKLIKQNQLRKVTVLKIPHHGSSTSTTEALIENTTPNLAVVPVGVNNKHGHPDKKVIKRLQKRKINILRTDKQGAVTIMTDGNSYQYQTYLK